MNTSGTKIFAFGIWLAVVIGLLVLKNKWDRAHWQAIADGLISKNQPPQGEATIDGLSTAGEVSEEGATVEVVYGKPPRGITTSVGEASEETFKALGRNERVLP